MVRIPGAVLVRLGSDWDVARGSMPSEQCWYVWGEIIDAAGDTRVEVLDPLPPLTPTPEAPTVAPGDMIEEWPEDDEHLRGWVIEDSGGEEWRWEPRERDQPGQHWRWAFWGSPEPSGGPWRVLRKAAE